MNALLLHIFILGVTIWALFHANQRTDESILPIGMLTYYSLLGLFGLLLYNGLMSAYFDILEYTFLGIFSMGLYVLLNIGLAIFMNLNNRRYLRRDLFISSIPIAIAVLFWFWMRSLNWKIGG